MEADIADGDDSMKLYCKGEYHNGPMNLHFAGPGVFEVDDKAGEYLLKDAPENFILDLPGDTGKEVKAFDAPPADKALKAPRVKK